MGSSTFRDWAGEETLPTHLAELALAHKVGSEVERAYARSDLLDKRRALMADWSAFVASEMKVIAKRLHLIFTALLITWVCPLVMWSTTSKKVT